MPTPFRSLRFKLALTYVAIFGAVLAVLGIVGVAAVERYLRGYFDEQLAQRAQQIIATLVHSEDPFSEAVFRAEARSVFSNDFYVQIRDAHGASVARSANLSDHELPFMTEQLRDHSDAVEYRTITGEAIEVFLGRKRALRMLIQRFQSPARKEYYLQVATDMEQVDESLAFLKTLFWLGLPAALVAAMIGSWFASGRAMARINDLSRTIQSLTPEKLEQARLPDDPPHDEVGALVQELKEMVARLGAGFKAQERFIYDASHELKTPLSILLAEAQVLHHSKASEQEYRRFIESVIEEARHLGQLVDSLLTLTRAEGRDSLVRGRLHSINDAALAALQECQPMAQDQAVTLDVQLLVPDDGDDDRSLLFRGNGDLMSAMISNLLRNAIRFSPRGSSVQMRIVRENDDAVIDVRDRGPGVPPEMIDKIFDRFVQAEHNVTRRGYGIGLAIARTVTEVHGGRISAENLADGGCRFTAVIPLARRRPRD